MIRRELQLVQCVFRAGTMLRNRHQNLAPFNFPAVTSTRSMFAFLDHTWNRVDKDRIKEVGPQVAAAEWIIRCGGAVKWKNHDKFVTDYNQIGLSRGKNAEIEAIDASNACIMGEGFDYLKGLSGVKSLKLHKAYQIEDGALRRLGVLKDSLKDLEVSSCGNVTDNGIRSLDQLENLKKLHLFDLPAVKNPKECVEHLKKALPDCQIDFPSP